MPPRTTNPAALLTPALRQLDAALLVPPDEDVQLGLRRAETLTRALNRRDAWRFEVLDTKVHGSLSRGTSIRTHGDVDLLVVLNPEQLRTARGQLLSPAATIRELATHIEAHKGGLLAMGMIEVRRQGHSVGCWYPASAVSVDLVPAIRDGQGFLIPERETASWIHTRPAGAKARLTRAEGRCPEVRAAVRLLKGWARARGRAVALGSYAIESVVVQRAMDGYEDLGELVLGLLQDLAEAHGGRRLVLGRYDADNTPVTVRGAGEEGNLAASLHARQRVALIEAARWSRDELHEAVAMLQAGRSAHSTLRRLFVGRA